MFEWEYVVIAATACMCYFNTLYGSFVFDDTEAIVKNKDVLPSTPLSQLFRNDFWGSDISLNSSHKSYRPLTVLTYRWNLMLNDSKLDSMHFHGVNIFLYTTLCVMLIPAFKMLIGGKRRLKTAFLSALLFTVHPLHTEVVAGLVGRADLLSAVLSLLGLILYEKCIWQGSAVLFLCVNLMIAMAVFCKETAVTTYALCGAYDILNARLLKNESSLRMWISSHRIFFYRNLALLAFSFATLYFRFWIMNFEKPVFAPVDNPAAFSDSLITRVLTYNYIYFLNLVLLIWPEWLCFDWSMGCVPTVESIFDYRVVFVVFFWCLTAISGCKLFNAYRRDRTRPAALLACALMILPFIPASNIFVTVGFVIAERALLLPSAGFCLLVILGLNKLTRRYPRRKKKMYFGFYILWVIFTFHTILRNFDWLKEEHLFRSALSVCPRNAKVHYNIGKVAADQGDKNLALEEYRRAIELNPTYEQAMNNLANLLREDKRFNEAEVLLREALTIRPNFAAAWMNLGIVLTNLNQSDEAEMCYLKAISFRPKYPDCYYNLGNLYLDMKRNQEALKAWEKAVAYRPSHTSAWSNTLVLLDSLNRYSEVLELGKVALMHNPKSPALHFSIGNTLGKMKQFEKAEKHFLEALNFNSNNALYYSNLGVLYHRWGKTEKAKEMYKKALNLNPNMKNTESNLRKLMSVNK